MILVDTLFKSFCEYALNHVCGPNPLFEWNRKLNESQKELIDLIAPQYDINERIRSIVRPLIKFQEYTSVTDGSISYPNDFYRLIGAVNANGFSLLATEENMIGHMTRIPQRTPSIAKKLGYWHPSINGIKIYPSTLTDCNFYYIKKPVDGKLTYAYEADVDTNEMMLIKSVSGTINLDWDENAFNLLLYKLLEKYGIIDKNTLNIEYAKIGVKTDLSNPV